MYRRQNNTELELNNPDTIHWNTLGIADNRIYLGLKSVRLEGYKTHMWGKSTEKTLMNLDLLAWQGKGYTKWKTQHPDSGDAYTDFVLDRFIVSDSIKTKKLWQPVNPGAIGGYAEVDTFENRENTFYDITLLKDRTDGTASFYLGVQNRRTDPLIWQEHDNDGTINWEVDFYSTAELEGFCRDTADNICPHTGDTLTPSEWQEKIWKQLGCREIVIPFKDTTANGDLIIYKVKELGKDSPDLAGEYWMQAPYNHLVDTTIVAGNELRLKLRPGQGKILHVKRISPGTDLHSGDLSYSNQTKIVCCPVNEDYCTAHGDTTMSSQVRYHRVYSIPVIQSSRSLCSGTRKVFYQRSNIVDKDAPEIKWDESPHLISKYVDVFTPNSGDTTITEPTCGFPTMVIRPATETRNATVHIVYNIRKFFERNVVSSSLEFTQHNPDDNFVLMRYGIDCSSYPDSTSLDEIFYESEYTENPFVDSLSGWTFIPTPNSTDSCGSWTLDSLVRDTSYHVYDSVAVIEHSFPANYTTFPTSSAEHGKQIGTAIHGMSGIPVMYDYDTLLTKWGLPSVNASATNNYYAWSDFEYGLVAGRVSENANFPQYIPLSDRTSIRAYGNDSSGCFHPCLNTYSRISDGEDDCALVWEENENGNYNGAETHIFYTRLNWCNTTSTLTSYTPQTWGHDSSWYQKAEYMNNGSCVILSADQAHEPYRHLPFLYRDVSCHNDPSHHGGMRSREFKHDFVYWQGADIYSQSQKLFHKVIAMWDSTDVTSCLGYSPNFWQVEGQVAIISPRGNLAHVNAAQGTMKKRIDENQVTWYSFVHNNSDWSLSADSIAVINFVEFPDTAQTYNPKTPVVPFDAEVWQLNHSSHDLLYNAGDQDFSSTDRAFRVGLTGKQAQLAKLPYINNDQYWNFGHRLIEQAASRRGNVKSTDYLLFKKSYDEEKNYFFMGYTDTTGKQTTMTPIYIEIDGREEAIRPSISDLSELEGDTLRSKWLNFGNYEEVSLLSLGNTDKNLKILLESHVDGKKTIIPLVDDKGKMKCNKFDIGFINGNNKKYRFVWIPKNGTDYQGTICLGLPTIDKVTDRTKVSGTAVQTTSYLIDLESGEIGSKLPSEKLRIFPNPAKSEANVYFTTHRTSNIRVELFSQTGKKMMTIHSGDLSSGQHKFKFNTNNLSPGVYLIRLSEHDRTSVEKLIIER